jgi:pimeloyl-ACP methyl ester carboxylesterase
MSAIADINTVRTWYDETGDGDALVLFHPGGVDSRSLHPNPQDALAAHFRVFTPERRGHGHTADVDGPYTFELLADDAIGFIERIVQGPAHLVGISDGAIVALLVAHRRPDLAKRLAVIAGPAHFEGWIPEAIDPTNTPPQFMADMYAEFSPDGADHFPIVVAKLTDMHLVGPSLTSNDLGQIASRTLVMIGDDDEVTLEHAISMYRSIPDAELAVIPGTSHGLHVEKPELCNSILVEFLTTDPVATMAPIRRRHA